MLFDEELDEEITKQNVDRLLKKYHNIKRLAGSYTPKITSTYSMIPRSETGLTSDSTSEKVSIRSRAQKQFKEILDAFSALSLNSRNRIYLKYMAEEKLYDYQIYNNENISKDTYYRELGRAQLEFAEAYKGGELIVFDYKRKKSD